MTSVLKQIQKKFTKALGKNWKSLIERWIESSIIKENKGIISIFTFDIENICNSFCNTSGIT